MGDLGDWKARLAQALDGLADGRSDREAFVEANSRAVSRALAGSPVDGGPPQPGMGGRVVVNMAAAHVPEFTRRGEYYRNAYQLDQRRLVGQKRKVSRTREAVDAALAQIHGQSPSRIWFAAVEFNGCGVGFYGDFCLVLRELDSPARTIVLDRNSYDLVREPLRGQIERDAVDREVAVAIARADAARERAGELSADLPAIAAIKVLEGRTPVLRLLTTGAVSDGILDDEDYIEVLLTQSFEVGEVAEVRLAPADVALDERIRARALIGRAPSKAETHWRDQRRKAEDRLGILGVPVRVMTSAGRMKG